MSMPFVKRNTSSKFSYLTPLPYSLRGKGKTFIIIVRKSSPHLPLSLPFPQKPLEIFHFKVKLDIAI